MKIIGITRVKDEIDVLPYVLELLQHEVDGFVLCDNNSTDGTREFLYAFQDICPLPVVVVDDPEVGYYQSDKMTWLARTANELLGATWIIPFDADEVWTAGSKPIRQILGCHDDWMVVRARLYDHVPTGEDDPDDPNPLSRIQWRRASPAPLHKVAVRWDDSLVIEMGNHGAHYDFEVPQSAPLLEVRHFPYRSVEQVLRKTLNGSKAYAATDLPEHYGAHWRQWGKAVEHYGDDWITEMFYKYYWRAVPSESIKIDGERQSPLYRSPVWPST